ncbi:MAG: hypothetical protein H0V66_09990 [Bdellovibrionales bacterium]|nr:hypothetical protein [Bdellovibrionales bacterium]
MKILFFVFTLAIGTSAWAGQEQNQDSCPDNCEPPQQELNICHARMVDCYGRPIETYWGRAPQYQVACKYAVDRCISEARMGYGGPGARCYVLGK